MSWLELDDRLLEHPKFVRAVKLGGSETVHMWLGIRAYCGQNLSDGVVPADMIDEVRGPASPRKRARAIEVLREVGLIEAAPDGGLMMHDFLQWSRSRAQILHDRERARSRQANRRGAHEVPALSRRDIPRDTRRDSEKTSGAVTRASASASASASPTVRSDPPVGPPHGDTTTTASVTPEPEPATDRETVCPLDLPDRADRAGIMLQYARAHSTTPSEIRKIVEEITAHWTIGPGAGTRRRNWLATVRRRLHELAQRGEIRPVTGKPSVPPEEYARREAAYQAEMVERRKRRRAENEAWLAEHAPDSEAIVRDALAGGSLL